MQKNPEKLSDAKAHPEQDHYARMPTRREESNSPKNYCEPLADPADYDYARPY